MINKDGKKVKIIEDENEPSEEQIDKRTCYSEKGGFSELSTRSMVIPTPSAQIPKDSQSGSYQPG